MRTVPRPGFAIAAYVGLAVLAPSILYLRGAPLPVRFQPNVVRGRAIEALRELHTAGAPMIQWGWVYEYFILTGTTWGTRTGGSHEILEPFFPNKEIFVADYVANLESGRAPVFLDTATEGAPAYANRERYGHVRFPEIEEAVRRRYFLCADLPGARLYLNRKTYDARAGIRSWCMGRPRREPPPPV